MNDQQIMKETFAKKLEEPFPACCLLSGVQGGRKTDPGQCLFSSPPDLHAAVDHLTNSERCNNHLETRGDTPESKTTATEKQSGDGASKLTSWMNRMTEGEDGGDQVKDVQSGNSDLLTAAPVSAAQCHDNDLGENLGHNCLQNIDTASEETDANTTVRPGNVSYRDVDVILTSKTDEERLRLHSSEDGATQHRNFDSDESIDDDEELEVTCSPVGDEDERRFFRERGASILEAGHHHGLTLSRQIRSGGESLDEMVDSEAEDTCQTFDSKDNDGTDVSVAGRGEGCTEEEKVGSVMLYGYPIVCLHVEGKERLCLAQISSTLLQDFSYNEIHNRRVALGITCLQCTPQQLEVLRRSGAMPISSRRCGLITKREAERLVRSFISDVPPPRLPDNFTFKVRHSCGWGCEGYFVPARYNSSRAKCIKCCTCEAFFSPNKFIFHYHRLDGATYRHPDAANFNSWRRHLELVHEEKDDRVLHAWEDVKAMFNGGSRKRLAGPSTAFSPSSAATASLTSMSSAAPKPMPLPPPLPLPQPQLATSSMSFPSALNGGVSLVANTTCYRGDPGGTSVGSSFWPLQPSAITQTAAQLVSSNPPSRLLPQPGIVTPAAAAVAAAPHPAFYANGSYGRIASYGEFLRTMSLPYNTSNNNSSSGPTTGSMLGDWHRLRLSGLLPVLGPTTPPAAGVFAAAAYPISPFGYQPAFVGAASDGVVACRDRSQVPPLQICSPQDGALSGCSALTAKAAEGSGGGKGVLAANLADLFGNPAQVVNEGDRMGPAAKGGAAGGGSVRGELGSEYRRLPTTANNAVSPSLGDDDEEANQKKRNSPPLREPAGKASNGMKVALKDEDNTMDALTCYGACLSMKKTQDSKKTQPVAALPKDTESLLKIFEETGDMECFMNLPIGKLRRLVKTARAKSQAVEREITKVKDMQRLQRLRAAELREEFSRQFFTLKENVWADIEHERRLKTALQNRLTEAKLLVPKMLNPSLPAYPDLE